MAERFSFRKRQVHFSNAAGEMLYRAWLKFGRALPASDESREVSTWLERQVHQGAEGGRGFSFDSPPAELNSPARLLFLLESNALLVAGLAKETPDPSLPDIPWTRELRISWLARLLELDEMLRAAIGPPAEAAKERIALPPAERIDTEIARLDAAFERTDWESDETLLPRVDRIIELIRSNGLESERASTLVRLLERRSEILVSSGRTGEAANDLRAASALERDPDLRQAMTDYASELANQN